MPTSPTTRVIEHLRRVVLREGAGLGDGELLGRFLERHDEAALAALVRRHGPMVWGVCRRLLSHHDAEDAFQATFLVLVRKAPSVVPREVVGNWLYGVAHQTALQARRTAARRKAREVQVKAMPDTEAAQQDQWRDVQPLLDQELSRLPDIYRAVLVLCDLEGRTRKEVACQLGVPEGTVAGRLARARAMLAKRLTQRGVALSGGALAAVLAQQAASAGVPYSVVDSTIKAANLFAAGQAVISSKVAALAEGVLKAMLLNKLKPALAVLVVVAMVGLIGYGMARGQQKGDAVQKQASEPKAQKDAVVKEKAEKEDATAWGNEVDGLQAGLAADSSTCRQGEKLKLTFKLRNVGKAEVTVDCGILSEWAPQVTTGTGGRVTVYTPPPFDGLAIPIKWALKPGETITLYNPRVFVESEDRAKVLRETLVNTTTICVAPGKYKILFDGMIQSHPKLATGTVEFEVKEPAKPAAPIKDDVAWGKEADGLQAGIVGPSTVRIGENATFTLKLRNVGKAEVSVTYLSPRYWVPEVTTDTGGRVRVYITPYWNFYSPPPIPIKRTLKPGETITLDNAAVAVESEDRAKLLGEMLVVGSPTICVAPGKYKIEYRGMIHSHPKLATGTLELEIKSDPPQKQQEKEKDAFTAWGKKVGRLQAGLGFRPGEKRAYHHGEKVTLVLRVRNPGDESDGIPQAVEFNHIWAFFVENPPTITDANGKVVQLPGFSALGMQMPRSTTVVPGKEVELYEWSFDLRPIGESGNKGSLTIHGTGKFSLQCERIVGPTSANPNHPNLTLDKLATGKLELEIKSAPPAAKGDKEGPPDAEKADVPRPGARREADKSITIRVVIDKVNAASRAITASCVALGEIDGERKPLRLENLSVSKFATIKINGKEVAELADLKPGTGARLELDGRETTLTVIGIEVIGDPPLPGATEKK